jgi:site-specific recombinase XerD
MELSQDSVKSFADSLRLRGRQPATVESYCRDAAGFVDFLERKDIRLGDIEPQTLIDYQDHLKFDGMGKENSVRRAVIGIRQFFRFIVEKENIGNSPLDDVPIPVRFEGLPESLLTEDLDLLFDYALHTVPQIKSTRDGAILALLGLEGLKAGEVINLRWSDFLDENHGGSLKISGPKSRVIRLSSETTIMISMYKDSYKSFMNVEPGSLFKNRMFIAFRGRDAAIPIPKITRHGLKFMLYELGEKSGLHNLNTEILRHHATSYLLEQGKSPDEIMAHFGLKRIGNIAKHMARGQSSKGKS